MDKWLEADKGRKFCSENCFKQTWPKCTTCHKPMNQWITDERGKQFCSESCFSQTFPSCDCCGKKMKQWTTYENGKKYCSEQCAKQSWHKCSICSTPMNQWITDERGREFCSERCHSQTFPVCDCCGKRMKEWTTYKDGKKYCSEQCTKQSWFKCYSCSTRMNQWLETENGHKYCSERCLSTTWPKCDVCSKPMQSWSQTKDGKRFCSTECAEIILPTCDCCSSPMQEWYENELGAFCSNRCADTEKTCTTIASKIRVGIYSAGVTLSAAQYANNAVISTPRGHGFAAERANHLFDKLSGKKAILIGGDNAKNGADRLVDGIKIQTKYCKTGSKCVEECFENGKFRYLDNGRPMQIEVPSDKYSDAVQAMKSRISKGQISGVTDPNDAAKIIKKGNIRYDTARNIAKFGTVESITYDITNHAVNAAGVMGLSATVSFAYSIWSGQDFDSALKQACYSGLQIGGVVLASGVLTSQLGKTDLVRKGAKSAAETVLNKLDINPSVLKQLGIKDVQGNLVGAVATVAVVSSVDIYRMFDGKISGSQLFKNISTTAAGVGAGTVGYIGTGIMIISWGLNPIVGAIVCSIGATVTSSVGSSATKAMLNQFIEDDAEQMFRFFKSVLTELAMSFLLTEQEISEVSKTINSINFADEMRNMYSSSNRKSYAVYLVKPIIVQCVASRPPIVLPSNEQLLHVTRTIFEAG